MQADLIAAKDRGLQADLKGKDLEIAEANKKAADANERAGKAEDRAKNAEEKAAQARQKAEAEHLDSVYIEQSFSARRLTQDQSKILGNAMSRFAPFVSVGLWVEAENAEEDTFARDIALALYSAGIKVFGPASSVTISDSLEFNPKAQHNIFGVKVDSGRDSQSYDAANVFVTTLNTLGYDACATIDEKINGSGIRVSVNPRPQGPQGEGKLSDSKRSQSP